jgi:hypothetical protein
MATDEAAENKRNEICIIYQANGIRNIPGIVCMEIPMTILPSETHK